ncbi:PD-(D/E)XK nuclease family protein (plasmid) [Okeanomitos corallinicola TIOX110]|uniref:PD-(D/E)XK nuclease family protein n=1 Tax=Okeanomitos corallinicola TIOX110 TaxID=3133117 RepID=A0ABZ2UZG9_9CYAN
MKWSISTHNCVRRCQKQYFFSQRMASHSAKDTLRREAFIFKQLSSLDEWRGSLVHKALEKYLVPSLKQRQLISLDELNEQTVSLAKKQFEFSQQKKYRDPKITKTAAGDSYLALRNHEYGLEIPQISIDNLYKEIKHCYQYLYSEKQFIEMLQKGNEYFEEYLINFKVHNCSVSAKLDLIMSYGRDKLYIIDWKISRSKTSDYSRQLNLYALAVLDNWRWRKYKPEELLLIEANLLQGKIIEHYVNQENINSIDNFIYQSISQIKALSGDSKYNLDSLEDYDYANSPLSCEYCNFQQMCVRLTS